MALGRNQSGVRQVRQALEGAGLLKATVQSCVAGRRDVLEERSRAPHSGRLLAAAVACMLRLCLALSQLMVFLDVGHRRAA